MIDYDSKQYTITSIVTEIDQLIKQNSKLRELLQQIQEKNHDAQTQLPSLFYRLMQNAEKKM